MRSALLPLAIAALILAPHAAAATYCDRPPSEPEIDAQGVYVDSEPCAAGDCIISVWIYEETNGVTGLQRDDFRHSDVCGDEVGDRLVFLLFAADPRA